MAESHSGVMPTETPISNNSLTPQTKWSIAFVVIYAVVFFAFICILVHIWYLAIKTR
ncbi:hypothetical protein ASPZODRAFT_133590 [Penicilliopsis zonata CBS 506.65]|uniref:Uncharacterized protein n=1 Tax=Penicilliopsis zonata CBS 506.65 TaxID=1073090 RepID=A0A1L9SFD0_9EURO|nr:hypothetical protein ASPZODRAFT_133590 [Penicilliopsis zonata CBS 506.65]OJJ45724.1 hypothetical protein ASPZODRAFT_133590 [Penicilliopsis zonata CBS 506.65]